MPVSVTNERPMRYLGYPSRQGSPDRAHSRKPITSPDPHIGYSYPVILGRYESYVLSTHIGDRAPALADRTSGILIARRSSGRRVDGCIQKDRTGGTRGHPSGAHIFPQFF